MILMKLRASRCQGRYPGRPRQRPAYKVLGNLPHHPAVKQQVHLVLARLLRVRVRAWEGRLVRALEKGLSPSMLTVGSRDALRCSASCPATQACWRSSWGSGRPSPRRVRPSVGVAAVAYLYLQRRAVLWSGVARVELRLAGRLRRAPLLRSSISLRILRL